MSRAEDLACQLARVTEATGQRDQALAAKLTAETAFNQAVTACRSQGFDWSGGLPDPGPAGNAPRATARAAHLAHDQARRELARARRRLDSAYRGLGRAVAAA